MAIESLIMYGMVVLVLIPIVAMGILHPVIAPETLLFGVRIPYGAKKEMKVKDLVRRFRRCFICLGLLIVLLALPLAYLNPMLTLIPIFVSAAVYPFVFIWAYRQLKKIKEASSWSYEGKEQVFIATSKHGSKSDIQGLAHGWWAIIAVQVIVIAIVNAWVYTKMPNTIPMHWNIAGEVDSWARKDIVSGFAATYFALFISLLLFAVHIGIRHAKRGQAKPDKPLESWIAYLQYTRLQDLCMLISAFITNCNSFIMLASTLGLIDPMSAALFIIVMVILMIAMILGISIYTGQMGAKLLREDGSGSVQDDDVHWYWGVFYHNPHDPSILVPKRIGIGWTFNFAHPVSIVINVALLLSVVLVLLYATVVSK